MAFYNPVDYQTVTKTVKSGYKGVAKPGASGVCMTVKNNETPPSEVRYYIMNDNLQ